MICEPCKKGEHCGSADCVCQHRHPGAWKGVKKEDSK